MYPSYLIHFNRQHDPKTGQFTYGDGDGDGIRNDHAHRVSDVSTASYKRVLRSENARKVGDLMNGRYSNHPEKSYSYATVDENGNISYTPYKGIYDTPQSVQDKGQDYTNNIIYGGGRYSDDEDEEQKKRRKRSKLTLSQIRYNGEMGDAWIDEKISNDYRLWDLSGGRGKGIKQYK